MDITVFHVSENELDQRSFEYAFSLFKRSCLLIADPASVKIPATSMLMLDSSGLHINNNEHNQSTVLGLP